ncbi:hypothetical protein D9M69_615640 [compost metagenome]
MYAEVLKATLLVWELKSSDTLKDKDRPIISGCRNGYSSFDSWFDLGMLISSNASRTLFLLMLSVEARMFFILKKFLCCFNSMFLGGDFSPINIAGTT